MRGESNPTVVVVLQRKTLCTCTATPIGGGLLGCSQQTWPTKMAGILHHHHFECNHGFCCNFCQSCGIPTSAIGGDYILTWFAYWTLGIFWIRNNRRQKINNLTTIWGIVKLHKGSLKVNCFSRRFGAVLEYSVSVQCSVCACDSSQLRKQKLPTLQNCCFIFSKLDLGNWFLEQIFQSRETKFYCISFSLWLYRIPHLLPFSVLMGQFSCWCNFRTFHTCNCWPVCAQTASSWVGEPYGESPVLPWSLPSYENNRRAVITGTLPAMERWPYGYFDFVLFRATYRQLWWIFSTIIVVL